MKREIIYRNDLSSSSFENLLRLYALNYYNPLVLSNKYWKDKTPKEEIGEKEDWEHDINVHNLVDYEIEIMIQESLLEGPCEPTITLKSDYLKRTENVRMKTSTESREGKMSLIKSHERFQERLKEATADIHDIWLKKWYKRKIRKVNVKIGELERILKPMRESWYKWYGLDEYIKKEATLEELNKEKERLLVAFNSADYRIRVAFYNRFEKNQYESGPVVNAYRHFQWQEPKMPKSPRKKKVEIEDDFLEFDALNVYIDKEGYERKFNELRLKKSIALWIEKEHLFSREEEKCLLVDTEELIESGNYTDFSGKYPNLHEQESIPSEWKFEDVPKEEISWLRREFLYPYDEGMEIQTETLYKSSFTIDLHEKLEKL